MLLKRISPWPPWKPGFPPPSAVCQYQPQNPSGVWLVATWKIHTIFLKSLFLKTVLVLEKVKHRLGRIFGINSRGLGDEECHVAYNGALDQLVLYSCGKAWSNPFLCLWGQSCHMQFRCLWFWTAVFSYSNCFLKTWLDQNDVCVVCDSACGYLKNQRLHLPKEASWYLWFGWLTNVFSNWKNMLLLCWCVDSFDVF